MKLFRNTPCTWTISARLIRTGPMRYARSAAMIFRMGPRSSYVESQLNEYLWQSWLSIYAAITEVMPPRTCGPGPTMSTRGFSPWRILSARCGRFSCTSGFNARCPSACRSSGIVTAVARYDPAATFHPAEEIILRNRTYHDCPEPFAALKHFDDLHRAILNSSYRAK
jgi:hypothetical protein